MSKHTKGPWSHRNGRIFQTDYDVLTIANVARAYDGDYSPSNGDLIAAAPELYESNIEMAGIIQEMCSALRIPLPQATLDRHDAAIAKAKGEQ